MPREKRGIQYPPANQVVTRSPAFAGDDMHLMQLLSSTSYPAAGSSAGPQVDHGHYRERTA
jgi:hypothetical protein